MEPNNSPGDEHSDIDQKVNLRLGEQDGTVTPDETPLDYPTNSHAVIQSLGENVLESPGIRDNRESIHDSSSLYGHTSSDMHNTAGISRESRSSPQPQHRKSGLSSFSLNNSGTSFLSNNSSQSGHRPQRPARDISEHSSDAEPSITSVISRVEDSLITLTNRFASLEQKLNSTLASNSNNQIIQNKLDAIAIESQNSSHSFTTIADILERSTTFQDTITANLRGISEAVLMYNNNLNEAMKACQEVDTRMTYYANDLARFDGSLNDFKYAWDVNRRLVNSYQEMILSLVSWLEPPALFFRNLARIFRLLVFWQGASGGENHIRSFAYGGLGGPVWGGDEDSNDHEQASAQSGNGVQENENAGPQDSDHGGDGGAGEQGVPPGDQTATGQQPGGIHDIEQEVDDNLDNLAGAQPVPGQFGSPFRADGLPWDTYNPGVNDTPTARKELRHLKDMMKTCWKYFLLLVFFICIAKLIVAPLPYFRLKSNNAQYTRQAASTEGTYLTTPILLTLAEAHNDARAVAELALQSAESGVACAKLDLDDGGENAGLFERWYRKLTMDQGDKCVHASSLATQTAERIKGLAIKLELAFGKKWWVTASSTVSNAGNTGTSGFRTKSALTEKFTGK